MKRTLIVAGCLLAAVVGLHAQQTIDQLSAGSAVSGTDKFPAYQGANPATAVTAAQIKTYVGTGGTGVSSIQGQNGAFNLGGGLQFQNNGGNNFLNQQTGTANPLRNASFTSWLHTQVLSGDQSTASIPPLTIASFTGSVAAKVLTVTGTPTGTIAIWQRLTDADCPNSIGVCITTNAVSAPYGGILTLGSITGGSGYTNGTYTNVPLTGGNANQGAGGAVATVVVSGGAVTSVTITYAGYVYTVGNTMSATAASIGGTGSGFSVNVSSVAAGTVLNFASTTGVVAGMYVFDVTHPTAVIGGVTVASTTGTTVTLSLPTGYIYGGVANPGVSSGDTIAFSSFVPGSQIVGSASYGANLCSPACTGTGGAGTYAVNISQTTPASGTETMEGSGGWTADGIFVIPVGTPGTTILCFPASQATNGGFTISGVECSNPSADLTDLIMRFPMDVVDTSRVICPLYAPGLGSGQNAACDGGGPAISQDQVPVTLHLSVVYPAMNSMQPMLDTRMSCPSNYGRSDCKDQWAKVSTDLAPVNLQTCTIAAPTPIGCDLAYSWYPGGAFAEEINFHVGAFKNVASTWIILLGMDLHQTPGATCNGAALVAPTWVAPPPVGCIQNNPGPLEIPEAVADINHNRRFTQAIGAGSGTGFNAGNQGPIEATAGASYNTSGGVLFTFPLPVTMRCNQWVIAPKTAPSCPPPLVYYGWGFNGTFADLEFFGPGPTVYNASANPTVTYYGLNSMTFAATFTSLTTSGTPGTVRLGGAHGNMILIDSSMMGD
jgi:hypothetical protein